MGGEGGTDHTTFWIYSLFKLPVIIKNQIYLCFGLQVQLDGPITWGLIIGGEGRGHKSGRLRHYIAVNGIHCFLIFICHTVYSHLTINHEPLHQESSKLEQDIQLSANSKLKLQDLVPELHDRKRLSRLCWKSYGSQNTLPFLLFQNAVKLSGVQVI